LRGGGNFDLLPIDFLPKDLNGRLKEVLEIFLSCRATALSDLVIAPTTPADGRQLLGEEFLC
jgi:hypothetical protein